MENDNVNNPLDFIHDEDKNISADNQLALALDDKSKALKPKPIVHNKIEQCKLEQIVLDAWINENASFSAIAEMCNTELQFRKENGDEYNYPKIYPGNIKNYVAKMSDRFTDMNQDAFEQAVKGVKVVDKAKHLSSLIRSAYERKQMIEEFMTDAYESQDRDGLMTTAESARKHESHILDVLKTLTVMEQKMSTYVTSDFIKSLILKISDIIAEYDGIDDSHKQMLLMKIMKVVDLTKIGKEVEIIPVELDELKQ